jgi:hypothetical protein
VRAIPVKSANAACRRFYANGGCKCLTNEIVCTERDPNKLSAIVLPEDLGEIALDFSE